MRNVCFGDDDILTSVFGRYVDDSGVISPRRRMFCADGPTALTSPAEPDYDFG